MKKILFILLILFSYSVKAEVDCNKLLEVKHTCTAPNGLMNMNLDDELTCNIAFNTIVEETCNPSSETLKDISFKLNTPSTLPITSDTVGSGFTKSGTDTLTFSRETGIGEGTIYTYKIKAKEVSVDTSYNISISNIEIKNENNIFTQANLIGSNISFKVLRIKSSINTLSKLDISGYNLNPLFNSSTLNYTLTLDTKTSKVNIVPTMTSDTSTLSGDTGEKTLNYGENTFKINVKSETGVTKVYTVVVTRQDYRSNENGLKSLTVSNTSFIFKPDTLRYDLEVDKEINSVSIRSALIDPKSSYIEGTDSISKNLVVGRNTVIIKVKAENGDIKTYTINIVKNDGKSSVNSLSTLSVVGYENKIEFIPETLTYSLTVSSTVKEIEIKSNMTSTKSTYVEGFGNRKVTLEAGLNKVEIKVKSETGVVKTYIINITKEDPKDNTVLKSLKIDVEDFKFDSNKLEYELEVSNLVEKLNIEAITEEKGTKVNITGNDKLVVGKNTIKIEVLSESGKTKVYTLLVNKRDKASNVSKLKSIKIKDYELNFDSNKLEYTLKIKNENKLDINVEKLDPLTKYTVLGNSNLKYGSIIKIIASAEDGSSTEYAIKITKDLNGIIPLVLVTIVIIIISITAAKKNKKVKIIKKDKVVKRPIPLNNVTVEPKPVEVVPVVEDIVKTPVEEVEPNNEETKPIVEEILESPVEEKKSVMEDKKEDEILEI